MERERQVERGPKQHKLGDSVAVCSPGPHAALLAPSVAAHPQRLVRTEGNSPASSVPAVAEACVVNLDLRAS